MNRKLVIDGFEVFKGSSSTISSHPHPHGRYLGLLDVENNSDTDWIARNQVHLIIYLVQSLLFLISSPLSCPNGYRSVPSTYEASASVFMILAWLSCSKLLRFVNSCLHTSQSWNNMQAVGYLVPETNFQPSRIIVMRYTSVQPSRCFRR